MNPIVRLTRPQIDNAFELLGLRDHAPLVTAVYNIAEEAAKRTQTHPYDFLNMQESNPGRRATVAPREGGLTALLNVLAVNLQTA